MAGALDVLTAFAAVAVSAAAICLGSMRVTPELALFRVPSGGGFSGYPAPNDSFVPVGTALYKLDLPWYITPFHRETLDLYAMELGGGRWALSDAGGYDTRLQHHASTVHDALRRLMGEGGTLSLVLRTCPARLHARARPLRVRHGVHMQP